MELNIAENRNHLNYSKWVYVKRILWTFGKFFFRNSPRIAFGYRNTILRLFGAKIGKHVHIYSSTITVPAPITAPSPISISGPMNVLAQIHV